MPKTSLRITATIFLAIVVSACTGPASGNEGSSSQSQDPCAPENLPSSVQPLNELMRQFDNQTQLATTVTRSEIGIVVAPMKQIRGALQDQVVGACLDELKRLQLQYMDTTLEAVQPSSGKSPDAASLAAGLEAARQYHDQYTVEVSRLLGVTPTP